MSLRNSGGSTSSSLRPEERFLAAPGAVVVEVVSVSRAPDEGRGVRTIEYRIFTILVQDGEIYVTLERDVMPIRFFRFCDVGRPPLIFFFFFFGYNMVPRVPTASISRRCDRHGEGAPTGGADRRSEKKK